MKSEKLLEQYSRFFSFAKLAASLIEKHPLLFWLATMVGEHLHPAKNFNQLPLNYPERRWKTYLRTSFFATSLLYRIEEFPRIIDIEYLDPDGALLAARQRGGLILTFHHALAYHFSAFIGNRGVSLNVLALSPTESPLYPLYDIHAATWFSSCEKFFNGGKWIFLSSKKTNSLHRAVSWLKAKKCAISLHDFPNFYPNSRSCPVSVHGIPFNAPVGLIEFAVKEKLPISVGYSIWVEGNKIKLTMKTLNRNGDEVVSVGTVLERYTSLLNTIIHDQPEFWEGWGLLCSRA
jgi:hypothetical protein